MGKTMTSETLQQEVWCKAIGEMEAELYRIIPILAEGRACTESVESYARRGIAEIERALGRLEKAKKMYPSVGGQP